MAFELNRARQPGARWRGRAPAAAGRAGSAALARWAVRAACAACAALSLSMLPGLAQAQGVRSASGIYTCIDPQGRKLTSDRPIPECLAREQRVLNQDGSVRQVVPPTLTAEERAERDTHERKLAQERAAKADAARRDRNLMARFPDQAAHYRARVASLETVRIAIRSTEHRLADLSVERRRLNDEAEFYVGRSLPAYLKQQLDANDAAVEAQRVATRNQEAEMARINALYDAELVRLRQLWAGALPGALSLVGTPGAGAAGSAPVRP